MGKKKERSRPLAKMNAKELAKATAEFDREFVVDSFNEPTRKPREAWEKAKRKRGRPKMGWLSVEKVQIR